MIRRARIRLTLFYSTIFLLLFWSLSFGIYAWMNSFLGDRSKTFFEITNSQFYQEMPSDVVIDNLRTILLLIDTILLIAIPAITWLLTGNALNPVQKARKREQQFLSDASHELRTPLSILRAEMEVALKKRRSPAEYQKVIQSSKEEVDDLSTLVENLLYLSRENSKHSNPITEQIDLTELVTERIANFQHKARQKKLQLILQPSETNLVIQGNLHLLKRLYTNLLDNAIKYTSEGSITITMKKTKEHAQIAITDTGIGIPEEKQEKIFDRFYRTDESRSEQGYGLGLSIAKQIVQVHHGTVTVESRVGKGTTITLLFPLMH